MNTLSRVKSKLEKLIDMINTSFWFIPVVCIFGGMLILTITYQFDHSGKFRDIVFIKWLYSIDPVGARTLLSTVAGAVITVTSIAFSMIVVALTLASSQFGPRLLRNFMKSRKSQIALGMFVSTFVFCLALIRFVSIDEKSPFVPGTGLAVALLMTLICILMLVYLIHHVAISIQAEHVICESWRTLQADIDRMFPIVGEGNNGIAGELDWGRLVQSRNIQSTVTGYIQLIDYEGAMNRLVDRDMGLEVLVRPGDFICEGQRLALLHCQEKDNSEFDFRPFLVCGSGRTPLKDPEFAINQLVEVGLRALSPGINDPFTAISCINYLGSGLAALSNRQFPAAHLRDDEGRVRLTRPVVDFERIVASACDQLRQNCLSHPSVVIAFLKMLCKVASLCQRQTFLPIIQRQGDMLVDVMKTRELHQGDMQDIEERHLQLQKACQI